MTITHNNGSLTHMHGARDVLELVAEQWVAYLESGQPTDRRLAKVLGIYDSADRGDQTTWVDLDSVLSVSIGET